MPLAPPPLDLDGAVAPHDHPDIGADDGIIRRISDELVVFDPKIGGRRVSSMAFSPSSGKNGGMSVDLETLIVERGLEPRA